MIAIQETLEIEGLSLSNRQERTEVLSIRIVRIGTKGRTLYLAGAGDIALRRKHHGQCHRCDPVVGMFRQILSQLVLGAFEVSLVSIRETELSPH